MIWDMFMMEQFSLIKYNNLHDCEFVSMCCGASKHEYVETICASCNDHTGFECSICEKGETTK